MNQLNFSRLVHRSLAQPGRPEQSVSEHQKVLDLIAAKDMYSAEEAMREHVRSSHRALLAGLVTDESGLAAAPGAGVIQSPKSVLRAVRPSSGIRVGSAAVVRAWKRSERC
jgi:hypothetical protein